MDIREVKAGLDAVLKRLRGSGRSMVDQDQPARLLMKDFGNLRRRVLHTTGANDFRERYGTSFYASESVREIASKYASAILSTERVEEALLEAETEYSRILESIDMEEHMLDFQSRL